MVVHHRYQWAGMLFLGVVGWVVLYVGVKCKFKHILHLIFSSQAALLSLMNGTSIN